MDTRAVFDFVISFSNGGGLRGEGFRLDLPRPDLPESEIAALLVAHLGLLMVEKVELRNLRRVEEPHRGSRGVGSALGISTGTRARLPANTSVGALAKAVAVRLARVIQPVRASDRPSAAMRAM